MRALILPPLLLLCAVSQASAGDPEENKRLARRFYEQVWFSRNLSAVDELFAREYVAHDIGDRKGVREPAEEQKRIADFFWQNGTMTGRIDFQIAEGDLVATRWQWDFRPSTWWMKLLMIGARNPIPIINVVRFQDGRIVEIWNHRHDIDSGRANMPFVQGFAAGVTPPTFVGLFMLYRRRRRERTQAASAARRA